jgi:hypothetical protein
MIGRVAQHLYALVIFCRMLAWKNFEIVVSGPKTISVRNVLNDAREKLEFRDRIIKLSMGFSQMVVATSLQCYVYQSVIAVMHRLYKANVSSDRVELNCNVFYVMFAEPRTGTHQSSLN